MSKTRRFRKKHKNQKRKSKTLHHKKTYTGGFGESVGFPACTEITYFRVTDTQIEEFNRTVNVEMDCVISALQIFGILNSSCANILRLSFAGRIGFNIEQIESIFIYLNGFNYCFIPYDSFTIFRDIIQRKLQPGYAYFVGYNTITPDLRSFSHVLIIARYLDGRFVIIDPQLIPEKIAPLNDEVTTKYLLFPSNHTRYYILHNSTTRLDINQLEYVKDISSGMSAEVASLKYLTAQAQMSSGPVPSTI